MKRSPRVLILTHPLYRPDHGAARAGTERDVYRALKRLGYAVACATAEGDVRAFDAQLKSHRPDVVFNLLEEFRGEGVYDFHLVSYLEALGVPCTGCNPRGLILSRNKFMASALAASLGALVPTTRLNGRPTFPAFLKFNREHASRGITRENIVRTPAALAKARARMRRNFDGELVTQSFVAGAEVSVAVWGNARANAFPPWRLHLDADRVATEKIKFDAAYRRRLGVRATRFADPAAARALRQTSTRLFKGFDLSGYARFDYRLDAAGDAYLIDVNANPNLALNEDFACSARAEGLTYADILIEILRLARTYRPRR